MNIAPYPDNDSSEWVVEFIEQPRMEDNLLQFSYKVYASQSSKDGGDPAFLYNSHKAQARPNQQRIKTNLDGEMSHVSGLTVKPQELADFMANASEAHRWEMGDCHTLTKWLDDQGRELLPFCFPNYDRVDEGLDPQWNRETFRVELDEHVHHLIWDKYFPGVMERRLSGDRRGTTLDYIVAAGADDIHCRYNGTTAAWSTQRAFGSVFIANVVITAVLMGSGSRFLNVAVPQGTTIDASYITAQSQSVVSTTVGSRIYGDDEDDCSTFSDDGLADYASRRGTTIGGANNNKLPSAYTSWTMPTTSVGSNHNSPSINSVVQEIVGRSGWSSGNAMAIFWDDHNVATGGLWSTFLYRLFRGYELTTTDCIQLHIEYTPPTTAAVTGEIGNGATEQAVRSAT